MNKIIHALTLLSGLAITTYAALPTGDSIVADTITHKEFRITAGNTIKRWWVYLRVEQVGEDTFVSPVNGFGTNGSTQFTCSNSGGTSFNNYYYGEFPGLKPNRQVEIHVGHNSGTIHPTVMETLYTKPIDPGVLQIPLTNLQCGNTVNAQFSFRNSEDAVLANPGPIDGELGTPYEVILIKNGLGVDQKIVYATQDNPNEILSASFDNLDETASYSVTVQALSRGVRRLPNNANLRPNGNVITIASFNSLPCPPRIRLGTSEFNGKETTGVAPITVKRLGDTANPAPFRYTLRPGTAKETEDYLVPTPTEGTIPAGQDQVTFNIPIVNDTDIDNGESFTIDLQSKDGIPVVSPTSAIIRIENDDQPPKIGFDPTVPANKNFTESNQTVTLKLNRTEKRDIDVDVVVDVLASATTAIEGNNTDGKDYVFSHPQTIRIPANQDSATFTLDLKDDLIVDDPDPKTLTLRILSVQTGNVNVTPDIDAANRQVTLTITDNEVASTFQILEKNISLPERENGAPGERTFVISRNDTANATPAAVQIQLSGNASTGDYAITPALPTTLNFGAGESSKSFTIKAVDDTLPESNETLVLTLAKATSPLGDGTRIHAMNNSSTITIQDNDSSCNNIKLNPTQTAVNDNTKRVNANPTLTGGLSGALKYTWTKRSGDADLSPLDAQETVVTLRNSSAIIEVRAEHESTGEFCEAKNIQVKATSVPTSIRINENPEQLFIGQRYAFTAVVLDQFGEVITDTVLWNTSDQGANALSPNGTSASYTGRAPGTFTVSAQTSNYSEDKPQRKANVTFRLVSAKAQANVNGAYASPVPWKKKISRDDFVLFRRLAVGTTINIYTSHGVYVRTMTELAGDDKPWDLKNDAGEFVASGVYYYTVSDGQSEAKGKLVIIQ